MNEETLIAYLKQTGITHPDANMYFIFNFERLMNLVYEVTIEDIMHLRVPTTVITETLFHSRNLRFRVVDVGGQRGQRKKWIKLFSGVNALLFMCALSDYNLKLREDQKTNRMVDALQIFEQLVKSGAFERSSLILMMNKKDVFLAKLRKYPLKDYFPRYTGKDEFDEASGYFRQKFEKYKSKQQEMFVHFTCATETDQMTKVIGNVIEIIADANTKSVGLR